jgi:tetratricopeptide (TPR) repeat protein
MTETERKTVWEPTQKCDKLCKQAHLLLVTDKPAAAEKLYLQAMDIYPKGMIPDYVPGAIEGYANCEEKLVGNANAAFPYYRRAVYDPTTGDVRAGVGNDPNWAFRAALLFERNDQLADANKLYNAAAHEVNRILSARVSGQPHHKRHTPPPPAPVYLPEMTDKSTSLDVAGYSTLGLGIGCMIGISNDDARPYLKEAVAIKDTDEARYYLNKHKKEHPHAYVDVKP